MAWHLKNDKAQHEYLNRDQLKEFALGVFPDDSNFASWTWKTLLRDRTFYRFFPVASNVAGRPYDLDVRHRQTGKTRDEWALEIATRGHMHRWSELQEPKLWVIGRESLRLQYHQLYVTHDRRWHCTDAVRHDAYGYTMPQRELDAVLAGLSEEDRRQWDEQAEVQDINPCVYALIHWWIVTLSPS